MGVDSLSVGPAALAEIKKVIRSVSRAHAAVAVEEALRASSPDEVTAILMDHIQQEVDLTRFAGSWNLSRSN
jgi:phosphotransferase system enzyme I (PtsI)